MKPGSHLINASRSDVVDIGARAAALTSGHLHGRAIDVFPSEPEGNDAAFASPLTRFDNVLLTPHIGGSTSRQSGRSGTAAGGALRLPKKGPAECVHRWLPMVVTQRDQVLAFDLAQGHGKRQRLTAAEWRLDPAWRRPHWTGGQLPRPKAPAET